MGTEILLVLIYLGLVAVVTIDLRTTYIDLRFVLGIWLLELIYVMMTDQFSGFFWKEIIIVGVILGFYIMKLFYLGDCFFASIMPILYLNRGFNEVIINILASVFFLCLILAFSRKVLKQKEVPATPFLLIGSLMSIF